MAGVSQETRWLVITGGTVFTPIGKAYQKVCAFTSTESALNDRIRHGLRLVYGSDPFAEADASDEVPPWWALGAPADLEDSIALDCLERHLRRRRNLISTTIPRNSNESSTSSDSLLLTYETDPAVKCEDQREPPLSKDSFLKYLDALSEILFMGHGVTTEAVDLSSRIAAIPRSDAAGNTVPSSQTTPAAAVPGVAVGSGEPVAPSEEQPAAQRVENEGSAQEMEVISLPPTEILEVNEDCEEEVQGPQQNNSGGGGDDGSGDREEEGDAFDREHPRRSNRIFILDSIPKKKEPEPPAVEVKKKKKQVPPTAAIPAAAPATNNDHEAGPSRPPVEQLHYFKTRPMPKKPVSVVCGDAEGLWDPKNPFVITVTKVGKGNDAPEAIAAALELAKKKNAKKGLVVACNQFEKIGGRAAAKKWKRKLEILFKK
jgi:hypothetical protein